MKNNYKEIDNYTHTQFEGKFFLPKFDNDENDTKELYESLGLKIIEDVSEQEYVVEMPKGYECYFDYEHFSKQNDLVRSYHSNVCDNEGNVLFGIFTKRFGMRMIEFEVIK